jgi:hypothetical protein
LAQVIAALPKLRETFEGVEVNLQRKGSLAWINVLGLPQFISQGFEGFIP